MTAVILSGLLVTCSSAEAQQATKIHRTGYLSGSSPSTSANRREAFQQGLHELGYVEGKNIVIEWRWAHGKFDRLPALAAELVRLKVDVIVTSIQELTRSARTATHTIPIVMARDTDPVGNGFIVSLARPGGNITGLSSMSPEISGKHVELLKEIVPRLSRLAVLGTSDTPGNVQLIREVETAAGSFGVTPQYLDVSTVKDIEPAFRAAAKGRAEAILVLGSGIYASHRKQIVDLTVKNRLPAIFRSLENIWSKEDSSPTSQSIRLGPACRLFRR